MGLNTKCAKCGCQDSFLTTPPSCPTAVGCPTEECSNIQFAQCVAYTGGNLLCGESIVVPTDTNLNEALSNIIDYFCASVANISTTSVVAGAGITVTQAVVGNNTQYTIANAAIGTKKFVKEFTGVTFDGVTLTILGTEITACGLLTDACGPETNEYSDFTFNIMYLSATGSWIGLTNETGVSIEVNNVSGDISVTLGVAPIDPPVVVRITIIG
jgi:hypothetical protein